MDLKQEIQDYVPFCEQEEKDKGVMLQYLDTFSDVAKRENTFGHLTATAWITNQKRDKILMVHHNIYDEWSWVGGHADGEVDLLKVAMREAMEETGIQNIRPITEKIFTLDVLSVFGHTKKEQYVSAHQHLNLTYFFEASEEDELKIKRDENSGVRWLAKDEVLDCKREPYMRRIYEKALQKMETL